MARNEFDENNVYKSFVKWKHLGPKGLYSDKLYSQMSLSHKSYVKKNSSGLVQVDDAHVWWESCGESLRTVRGVSWRSYLT